MIGPVTWPRLASLLLGRGSRGAARARLSSGAGSGAGAATPSAFSRYGSPLTAQAQEAARRRSLRLAGRRLHLFLLHLLGMLHQACGRGRGRCMAQRKKASA